MRSPGTHLLRRERRGCSPRSLSAWAARQIRREFWGSAAGHVSHSPRRLKAETGLPARSPLACRVSVSSGGGRSRAALRGPSPEAPCPNAFTVTLGGGGRTHSDESSYSGKWPAASYEFELRFPCDPAPPLRENGSVPPAAWAQTLRAALRTTAELKPPNTLRQA